MLAGLRSAAHESVEYARRHMPLLGWAGVISLVSYHFIWRYLYPDDFESLTVRLIGALACAPAILVNRLGPRFQDWITVYWICGVTTVLPFVFGYLLAMNAVTAESVGSSNLIWPLQNVVALFIFILLVYNGFLATLLWLAASAAVLLVVFLTVSDPNLLELKRVYFEPMPMYVFILVVGSLAIRNREMVEHEKIRTVAAVGSTIAHELRTPFLGIRALAESIRNYLPSLLQTYDLAVRLGLKVDPIRRSHVEGLKLSLDRISDEIDYSNRVVDMLLINSSEAPVRGAQFVTFSASECVTEAVARFPFNNDQEVGLVNLDVDDDFNISAPRLLIVHVFFNLLKNSLYYVQKAGHGSITIRLEARPDLNRIVFEDTGTGVPPQIIDRIFERFFTTTESGYGAGIGLSFCRLVMQGVGGSIRCDSEFGSYTRFTLDFPNVRDG